MAAYVYIMASKRNGTLYPGVTSDIHKRAYEHRLGIIEGFTTQYSCKHLVFIETHETMPLAIQREKTIKGWKRDWKLALIEENNPQWDDLYDTLNH